MKRGLKICKYLIRTTLYLPLCGIFQVQKSTTPPYQATARFRPALASTYKLAQANIAYKRFYNFVIFSD